MTIKIQAATRLMAAANLQPKQEAVCKKLTTALDAANIPWDLDSFGSIEVHKGHLPFKKLITFMKTTLKALSPEFVKAGGESQQFILSDGTKLELSPGSSYASISFV